MIREYKALRPLLTTGRVYHLLPQPVLSCPDLPTPTAWEAYQFYDPRTRRGAILVFRGLATDDSRAIIAKGLEPTAMYSVTAVGGESVTCAGAILMAEGLICELLPLTSALVHLAVID